MSSLRVLTGVFALRLIDPATLVRGPISALFNSQIPHKAAHLPAYEPEVQRFALTLQLRDFFEEICE